MRSAPNTGRRHGGPVIHHVPLPELSRPGPITKPGEPVRTDFEGGTVRLVELSHPEVRLLGNTLAELRWHVPSTAPQMQEAGYGIVVRQVIISCQVNPSSVASKDNAIGAKQCLFFQHRRE